MKKSYIEPLADVIEFNAADVITVSGGELPSGLMIATNSDGFDDGSTLSGLFDF